MHVLMNYSRSRWLQEFPEPKIPETTRRRFGAAVIGGGYSGLSAAITLARQGIDTVLLERYHCGYGGSGRNGGHLTPTIGKDVYSLLKRFGKQKAGELVRFAEGAVDHTESVIRDLGIDCDYRNNGNILAAVTPGQEKKLYRSAQAASDLGLQVSWLSNEAMKDRNIPQAFRSGMMEHKGGTLHPGKYLLGLKAQALALGVCIIEEVLVFRYDRYKRIVIQTSKGPFEADRLVLAANAYQPLNDFIRSRTVPMTVSMLETEPLTPDQLSQIGWTGREGIYTGHEILESYRLTENNTILAGSKVLTPRANYVGLDTPGDSDHSVLTTALHDRFPMEQALKVREYWSGTIQFAIDFLPLIRKLDKNVTTACAYAGHGIAMATYGGMTAAELLQGRERKHYILNRRLIPMPPRPLLKWSMRLMVGILRWFDKRADGIARKLQSSPTWQSVVAGCMAMDTDMPFIF